MENIIKVSVAMATWNGEQYLAQQLDSILAQTRKPDELIICDDASQDGTVELLTEYALRHPEIHLICNEQNEGINRNFRKALSLCTGDLIFISDQDDIWAQNKLALMLEASTDTALIYSDAKVIDEMEQVICESEIRFHRTHPVQGRPTSSLLASNSVSGHNLAAHKSVVDAFLKTEMPDVLLYDHWLALIASCQGEIRFIPAQLCSHRIHQSNAHNNLTKPKPKKTRRLGEWIVVADYLGKYASTEAAIFSRYYCLRAMKRWRLWSTLWLVILTFASREVASQGNLKLMLKKAIKI
tara:strand:+ start:1352 stop:2242 length:891 start_codon:yes stop_codon:yes gene_type:complete